MHHTLISGTGRSGTTLLVKILTLAGHDTGFSDEEVLEADCFAGGLEAPQDSDAEVLKSPYFCDTLPSLMKSGMHISHVIIPMRDSIGEVALSRESTDRLWNGEILTAWELAMKLHNLVEACTRSDIPFTTISYPRWTKDVDYFIKKIFPIVWGNGQRLRDAWKKSV